MALRLLPRTQRQLNNSSTTPANNGIKTPSCKNNNARWYDPQMGRFLSADPSDFDGGAPNLYRYVGNDPVNHTDPTASLKPKIRSTTSSDR